MKEELFENLVYRHSFACLSDLIDHAKNIQEELEDLYLNVQELEDLSPDDRAAAEAILEQRLRDRQYRRRNLFLPVSEDPD